MNENIPWSVIVRINGEHEADNVHWNISWGMWYPFDCTEQNHIKKIPKFIQSVYCKLLIINYHAPPLPSHAPSLLYWYRYWFYIQYTLKYQNLCCLCEEISIHILLLVKAAERLLARLNGGTGLPKALLLAYAISLILCLKFYQNVLLVKRTETLLMRLCCLFMQLVHNKSKSFP